MVSKGRLVGLDWNRVARLQDQAMTGTHELTNSIALSQIDSMFPNVPGCSMFLVLWTDFCSVERPIDLVDVLDFQVQVIGTGG